MSGIMINCSNSTWPNSTFCPPVAVDGKMVLSLLCLCVISIFAIFGNGLVCAAFIINRNLRILTNFYVVSLALSDILVGFINIPLWMYWRAINYCNFLGNPLYEMFLIFDIVCGTASIWNMAAISIDRLLAVVFPNLYRVRSKHPKYAAWIIIFVWSLSILIGILRLTFKLWNYALFVVIISFFIPLFIILISYGTIYGVVRQRAKWSGSVLMEIRLARTLAIVIGAFILCWGPFFVFSMVVLYCGEHCSYGIAFEAIKWLQYACSCINPIIYTIRNKEFRFTFHDMVFRCSYRRRLYTINAREPRRTTKCCWCCTVPEFEMATRPRGQTFTEESQVTMVPMTSINGQHQLMTLGFQNPGLSSSDNNRNSMTS